jgi:4-hydroxy-3-polyprenylbenzoate decarboxylase
MKLVVGVTGASGVVYGFNLLTALRSMRVESHLIVSKSAELVINEEMEVGSSSFRELATYWYDETDIASPISSGSYKTDGMVIAPCSMKTVAGIANGYSDNLILRAADVTIKQGRKLILVPRESPFNKIHLRNLSTLAGDGVVILPASPGFYHHPKTVDDLVMFVVGKILDSLDIDHALYRRWKDVSQIENR